MPTADLPSRLPYPHTRKEDVVETLHGTPVPDPYRWLEDPDAPGTEEWIDQQNDLTFSIIRAGDTRERLRQRLTQVWDYPKYGVVKREGGRYFFWKNAGLQNQAVLYMQPSLSGPGSEPVAVLDPNTMSEDGTAAVTAQSWTQDGRLLGYALSRSGSDWQELRVRDLDSRQDLPDAIQYCKFTSPAWWHPSSPEDTAPAGEGLPTHDAVRTTSPGFFYSRFPDPSTVPPGQESFNQTVHWHSLGTPQTEDPLVYARPDAPELGFSPAVTDDNRYLVLHVWKGTDPKNRIYFSELPASSADSPSIQNPKSQIQNGPGVVRLLEDADARYDFVDNLGSTFYFNTDLDAPRGRVIAIDVTRPDRANWREIVPEGAGSDVDTIDFVSVVADHLVVVTMHHAHHQVKLYTLDGQFVREVPLPGIGSITGLSGKRTDSELFLAFTSFLHPTTVLRLDLSAGPDAQLETVHAPDVPFDPSQFETTQVFYESKDGIRVPMFITHKKGLSLTGDHPTLLYGYGGFNVSLTPSFTPARIAWLEAGGVYAIANLRGGGEYGEQWHQAGTILRKQNVFDDFIAAAEWLISHKYTRPEKLAIQGGSNGGLLVAACLLQRPDLYGAIVCQVPVADMLRYHRFTVGRFWVSDYGNADEDPEHFRYQLAYSPVHNCRPGVRYPATIITTADHDDRVAPAHAKKFAAALQEAQAGDAPILLRVDVKAGHGAGKPTAKLIEEQADIYAFLFKALDTPYNPYTPQS